MDSLIISVASVEFNAIQIVTGSVSVRPVVIIQLHEPVSVEITVTVKPPVIYFGEPRSLRMLTIFPTNDFRGPPQQYRRVSLRPRRPLPNTFDFVAFTDSPSVFNISQPLDISYNSHRV